MEGGSGHSVDSVGVKKPLLLGGTFPAKHVNGGDQRSTSHTSAFAGVYKKLPHTAPGRLQTVDPKVHEIGEPL